MVTGDVTEAVRAADLSLSAPVPPGPELLEVFLSIVESPPGNTHVLFFKNVIHQVVIDD